MKKAATIDGRRAVPKPDVADELRDRIRGEIIRAAARAAEQAEVLESIAARVTTLIEELHPSLSNEDLQRCAHEIEGATLHGFVVVAAIQSIGGRLAALAAVRSASTPDDLVGTAGSSMTA